LGDFPAFPAMCGLRSRAIRIASLLPVVNHDITRARDRCGRCDAWSLENRCTFLDPPSSIGKPGVQRPQKRRFLESSCVYVAPQTWDDDFSAAFTRHQYGPTRPVHILRHSGTSKWTTQGRF
jgi:hypothetical protein